MSAQVLGWHFTDGDRLRDGRAVPPVGEWLVHEGPVVMCESGLHFSERLIDALHYAPGVALHLVEVLDVVEMEDYKGVARQRRILWTVPEEVMRPLLVRFAWSCAWRAEEHARDAWGARAAARAAWDAWAAAWAAARDAWDARAAKDAWATARDEQESWLLAGVAAAGYDAEGCQP